MSEDSHVDDGLLIDLDLVELLLADALEPPLVLLQGFPRGGRLVDGGLRLVWSRLRLGAGWSLPRAGVKLLTVLLRSGLLGLLVRLARLLRSLGKEDLLEVLVDGLEVLGPPDGDLDL